MSHVFNNLKISNLFTRCLKKYWEICKSSFNYQQDLKIIKISYEVSFASILIGDVGFSYHIKTWIVITNTILLPCRRIYSKEWKEKREQKKKQAFYNMNDKSETFVGSSFAIAIYLQIRSHLYECGSLYMCAHNHLMFLIPWCCG